MLLFHINIFTVIFACIGKVVFEVSSFSIEIKLRKHSCSVILMNVRIKSSKSGRESPSDKHTKLHDL